MDPQVVGIYEQVLRLVLMDHLKPVRGDAQDLDLLFVDNVGDCLSIFDRLSFDEIDASDGHRQVSLLVLLLQTPAGSEHAGAFTRVFETRTQKVTSARRVPRTVVDG